MKDLGNKKFEESWKDAFADAEATPHESVWTNIDLQLSRAESGDMKRRVVFYQRLAAASVVFALALGSAGIWYWSGDETQQIASVKTNDLNEGVEKQNAVSDKIAEHDQIASVENEKVNFLKDEVKNELADSQGKNSLTSVDYLAKKATTNTKGEEKFNVGKRQSKINDKNFGQGGIVLAEDKEDGSYTGKNLAVENSTEENSLGELNRREVRLASGGLPNAEARLKGKPVEQIAAARKFKTANVDKEERKKKEAENENWWASVGGSAGSYNTQAGGASVTQQGFLNSTNPGLKTQPSSNRAEVGTSYSFGMAFGKKVTKRWVLLSGVNYLNQSIGYSSNIAVVDASNQAKAYLADLASQSTQLTSTTPYAVNSVNEFVSIPLQAGYLFIDRKVGLQLNTGIATDFFIKNTLTDESGKLSSYSESAGNNSYYRTLNWTGLVGTELSYKVAKHYRVSLVPGLRYSFNSVLKSSTGATLNPMVWDVGFRFRYTF
jgi:hypothetical protein